MITNKINPNNDEILLNDQQLYLGAKILVHIHDPKIVSEPIQKREFFYR